MIGDDDGSGLSAVPAVVAFDVRRGVVGVAGGVNACCTCPGGLVVVVAGGV